MMIDEFLLLCAGGISPDSPFFFSSLSYGRRRANVGSPFRLSRILSSSSPPLFFFSSPSVARNVGRGARHPAHDAALSLRRTPFNEIVEHQISDSPIPFFLPFLPESVRGQSIPGLSFPFFLSVFRPSSRAAFFVTAAEQTLDFFLSFHPLGG